MQTEKLIEKVLGSPASLFTKQDVVDLLSAPKVPEVEDAQESDDPEQRLYSYEDIQKLFNIALEKLEETFEGMCAEDVVDFSSAEFEISNNYVELNTIDFNSTRVLDQIKEEINLDDLIITTLM